MLLHFYIFLLSQLSLIFLDGHISLKNYGTICIYFNVYKYPGLHISPFDLDGQLSS